MRYYDHGYDTDDRRVGGGQPDAIRASNADRDAAAERLRTHHAAGRLTDDGTGDPAHVENRHPCACGSSRSSCW